MLANRPPGKGPLLPPVQKADQGDRKGIVGGGGWRGGWGWIDGGWPGLLQRFQSPLMGVGTHCLLGYRESTKDRRMTLTHHHHQPPALPLPL